MNLRRDSAVTRGRVIVRRDMKPSLLLCAAFLSAACAPSLPGRAVCSATTPCEAQKSCIVGRCRPTQDVPVPQTALRHQFEPVATAQLDGGLASPLQEPIVLSEDHTLLLRFAIALPPRAQLQSAWLELHRSPQCPPRAAQVKLGISHVFSRWQEPTKARWLRLRLSRRMHAATTRATRITPLRVEVTHVVRKGMAQSARFHGLLLGVDRAEGTKASPRLCYSSGLLTHPGPVLVLYTVESSSGRKGEG